MKQFVLKPSLKGMAVVLHPEGAIQPILPKAVRGAVHHWMTEIRAEEELSAVGVAPRRTALLSGPPGCGKTTLAHHLAARLGVALVCVHLDRLKSKYVGETENNVADLFDSVADQTGSYILFLDEFDAIGVARANVEQASDRSHNSVVDSLLARIESFGGTMIAATNRADSLDPAIWRRFGMQLDIPLPGDEERYAILKRYIDPFEMPDEWLEAMTDATESAAPSLLRQLMEGLKRDIVLAERLNYSADAGSALDRVIASVRPHADYATPPLWERSSVRDQISKIEWPPRRKDSA
jgi:SpoVK/Ycf46/Vps4 family AAA+-type ATPase